MRSLERVSGLQTAPETSSRARPAEARADASSTPAGGDPFWFQTAQAGSRASTSMHWQKVLQLRQAIEAGTYSVPGREVARSMLSRLRQEAFAKEPAPPSR